jgi:hypothetical protein
LGSYHDLDMWHLGRDKFSVLNTISNCFNLTSDVSLDAYVEATIAGRFYTQFTITLFAGTKRNFISQTRFKPITSSDTNKCSRQSIQHPWYIRYKISLVWFKLFNNHASIHIQINMHLYIWIYRYIYSYIYMIIWIFMCICAYICIYTRIWNKHVDT